jgi:hypothetical protein
MTDTDASTLRPPLDFADWDHQLLRLHDGEIRPFPARSEEAA